MFIAIFTMLLIINRQTGMMLEGLIMYILPIPLAAYCTYYSWKSGLPVMAAMIFMSVLFGDPLTIFYAVTECLLGLVLGTCLHNHVDRTKTMILIMVLSTIFALLCTVALAPLFGFDLSEDIAALEKMMDQVFSMMSQAMAAQGQTLVIPEGLQARGFIIRMLIIGYAFGGMLEGYIIYTLTVLILKRLRFPVEKPKNLFEFYPPKWTGSLAVIASFVYIYTSASPLENEILQGILQAVGIVGALYLMLFGILAVVLLCRKFLNGNKILTIIIVVMVSFAYTVILIVLGAGYIITDYHKAYMEGRW